MTNESGRFVIEFTHAWDNQASPDVVRHGGNPASNEDTFATTIAGAMFATRALQEAWGNGADFGGELAEMAARLFLLCAERELAPSGYWHFESDAQAAADGYGEQLAALRQLVTAAKSFVERCSS